MDDLKKQASEISGLTEDEFQVNDISSRYSIFY